MTKNRMRWPLALAAVGAMVGLATAAPASAASDSHCVVSVGSELPRTCFETFAKALQFASGGELVTGPKNVSTALRDPAFHAQVNAANAATELRQRSGVAALTVWTVLSIESDLVNHGGSSLIYRGSSGNCSTSTGNIDYQVSSMASGWNNEIESFYSYANCWVQHFENPNYGGAASALTGSRSTLGLMNNQTSSIRWT